LVPYLFVSQMETHNYHNLLLASLCTLGKWVSIQDLSLFMQILDMFQDQAIP
jgi:hypothetical protein